MCDVCRELDDPCCWNGKCQPDEKVGLCVCCGAEMFEENGCWFHHTQQDIPFEEREPQYNPPLRISVEE